MSRRPVVLRDAEPTLGEGRACGRYLNEAAEGFHTFMLGDRAVDLLATAYLQPNNSYSFENVRFAERDGRIVGMVLGFTGARRVRFSERPLKEAPGYPVVRAAVVKTLLAPLFRVLETVRDDDFYILAIAIDRDARRTGVGSSLMADAEDRARAVALPRLSLDVSAKNHGAIRLYEGLGFTVEWQWPERVPLPGVKLYRMAKTLSSS